MSRIYRVLMIEDNTGDVALFRIALKRAGCDVDLTVLGDGGAALDLIRQAATSPDLVILDLNLPKIGGTEILQAMRAEPAFENVPVVVWTSSKAPADRSQLEPLRVTKYFVKPPELADFLRFGVEVRDLLASMD